jgi:hypothetical protein
MLLIACGKPELTLYQKIENNVTQVSKYYIENVNNEKKLKSSFNKDAISDCVGSFFMNMLVYIDIEEKNIYYNNQQKESIDIIFNNILECSRIRYEISLDNIMIEYQNLELKRFSDNEFAIYRTLKGKKENPLYTNYTIEEIRLISEQINANVLKNYNEHIASKIVFDTDEYKLFQEVKSYLTEYGKSILLYPVKDEKKAINKLNYSGDEIYEIETSSDRTMSIVLGEPIFSATYEVVDNINPSSEMIEENIQDYEHLKKVISASLPLGLTRFNILSTLDHSEKKQVTGRYKFHPLLGKDLSNLEKVELQYFNKGIY